MSMTIKNLVKKFGNKIIFDGFSYNFPDRGIIAVMGKSGVGKTTLLRIIAGLDTDFSGSIDGEFDCAFAFQEYRLFPTLNALENAAVAFGNTPTPEEIAKASLLLKTLFFSDTDLLLFPSALSGGMKQRVSLARTLLANKKVVLMDEPTKELDTQIADIVLKLIKEIGEHSLVIIVTHNVQDAEKLNADILNI